MFNDDSSVHLARACMAGRKFSKTRYGILPTYEEKLVVDAREMMDTIESVNGLRHDIAELIARRTRASSNQTVGGSQPPRV